MCCVALLQVGPRSYHDYPGWVADFIAFECAAYCAVGENIIDAKLVGVVDPVDNYWTIRNF